MPNSNPIRPRLSIVFLNYNRLQETTQTLEQLSAIIGPRNDVEIIAVDNGSTDGTAEYLASRSDLLIPVLLSGNEGIAGYNVGFEKACGEYILVLDDDSCPADAVALDNALSILDSRPSIGIVACRIENPDGTLQSSWNLPVNHDHAGASMSFIGCGFFIRSQLFREIGWYPGEFFLYQNEMEVAIRVGLRGMGILYEPACRVIHRGQPAQRPNYRRIFYPTRNTLWIIRRYFPLHEAIYMSISRLFIGLGRALWFRQFRGFLHGAWEGLTEPIQRVHLSPAQHQDLAPFRRQNSLIHQLLRLTQ